MQILPAKNLSTVKRVSGTGRIPGAHLNSITVVKLQTVVAQRLTAHRVLRLSRIGQMLRRRGAATMKMLDAEPCIMTATQA